MRMEEKGDGGPRAVDGFDVPEPAKCSRHSRARRAWSGETARISQSIPLDLTIRASTAGPRGPPSSRGSVAQVPKGVPPAIPLDPRLFLEKIYGENAYP